MELEPKTAEQMFLSQIMQVDQVMGEEAMSQMIISVYDWVKQGYIDLETAAEFIRGATRVEETDD